MTHYTCNFGIKICFFDVVVDVIFVCVSSGVRFYKCQVDSTKGIQKAKHWHKRTAINQ